MLGKTLSHYKVIEKIGQTKALVLQLIEGPTLAHKIAQGPIPVEDVLKIALVFPN